ncbi:MAG: hypothetical protein ACHQT9_02410 [Candidatus Saccharimonadales bacterium]
MKSSSESEHRFARFLSSEKVFWAIVVFFVFEALWIALSGRYPMAFDEDFHLGIIRIYAHHLSPFWGTQPPGTEAYGAISRDPAFLYHWLMSFPYRLISLFTNDQNIQVIILRFINIGLLGASLPFFRRLLAKTGASKALVNASLGIFVLVPVVPLLAAQINYDNLMIPMTAISLLLTVSLTEKFSKKKPIDVRLLLLTLIACLSTSLVKYSFLPIFIVIIGFVYYYAVKKYSNIKNIWLNLKKGFTLVPRKQLIALVLFSLIFFGVFIQRYGVNIVKYHKPVPGCSQVLTEKQCSNYGPWLRDYTNKQAKDIDNVPTHLNTYIGDWFYGMWLRSFFTVDGPATLYETRGPFRVPAQSAIIFIVLGTAALIFTFRRLLKKYHSPVIWLFVITSLFYLIILWLDDYQIYLSTAAPVAINGRYIFPVLPLIILVIALAYDEVLRKWYRLKVLLMVTVFICMILGGGSLTYILRSRDVWYWNSQPVYDANHAVQRFIGPITPGYRFQTEFLR